MKVRISAHIKLPQYIFGFLTLVFLYNLFHSLVVSSFLGLEFKYEIIPIIFSGSLHYYYKQRKCIEYDDKYLYISSFYKNEKMPLNNVNRIKKTLTEVNGTPSWKIDYTDNNGKFKSVRVIPNSKHPEVFEDYKSHIKNVNPKVEIINKAKTI